MAVKQPQIQHSLFSYKKGNSFLHKMNPGVKIIIIPVINILICILPPQFALCLIALQTITAFFLRFTLKEQLCDLKPAIYYAFILFFTQLISAALSKTLPEFSWQAQKTTVLMLLKLFAIMQLTSIVFKTSTSLELRNGIAFIFGRKSAFTNTIFLFLNFIPLISKIWEQTKKAWLIRGGKQNIKMYKALIPVLFSVGMKKAWNTARALEIRK